MAKESFLRGAFILAAASGISRIVGIVHMVILPRIIFDEGVGLFQLVKPLYYFAAVVAISGMPVAVSKLVAEKAARGSRNGVVRVFRLAMTVMTLTGILASAIMIGGARLFTEYVAKDMGVYLIIIILGPAAFFLAISAGIRGFFQGMQHMTPTAVSQITDQIVRVGATIILAMLLMPRGVEWGAAGAAMGSVIGEFVSMVVLVGFYVMQHRPILGDLRDVNGPQETYADLLKRMAKLAFPVVVATVLWPVMQMADAFLIPLRMQVAGFSPEEVRDWVGYLGMALTISQFPNIVTVALATSLVPAISEASSIGSQRLISRRTTEAVRVAIIFGLPSFAGLYVLAEPISKLLFNYVEVGAPLKILAVGTLTLGLIQSTTGVLQGLGLVMIPVRNLLVGVLVKFALNYFLIANPAYGVLGAAWGSTAGWVVAALLNLVSLLSRVGFSMKISDFLLKPVMATALLGLTVYFTHDLLSFGLYPLLGDSLANAFGTLSAIVIGATLYFLTLMAIGAINRKDIELIPRYGTRLSEFFHYWGFLRK